VTLHLDDDTRGQIAAAAFGIRRLSVEMITWAQWGHIGGSFSMAELLAVLYFHHMSVRPEDPAWEGRDRLILSKAHGSSGLYAALALRGYFPESDVYGYCELGGRLEGHTDMLRTPGLESSGGPLGMGLSVAVGRALACATSVIRGHACSASWVTASRTRATSGKRRWQLPTSTSTTSSPSWTTTR